MEPVETIVRKASFPPLTPPKFMSSTSSKKMTTSYKLFTQSGAPPKGGA